MMAGFRDVETYPYSFFKVCCEVAAEAKKELVILMASAIGVAFSGDKTAIEGLYGRDKD